MGVLLSILIVLLALFTIIVLIGIIMSMKFTRRSYLNETSSPADSGLDFMNVAFPARDGVELKGWYIPSNNCGNTIIQLHGHAGSMDPDIHYATDFHEAGFNVLMFDFRAHGRSEGLVCTYGYQERNDVLGAIDFVKSQGATWIALVGFSMGGMVAILTAPITKEIKAVISDGAPARIRTALIVWLGEHKIHGLFADFLAGLVILTTSLRLGVNLFNYEPIRWIRKIAPTPLMLIHGEADEFCPDFYEMATLVPEAEIWCEPGIGHVQISHQLPDQYKMRVTGFLKKNMQTHNTEYDHADSSAR